MILDGFALVTGAGSGISRDIALAYAASGAAGVAFADIDLKNAERVSAESKAVATNPDFRALVLPVDVSLEQSVEQMMSEVVASFGRIDYAVNSAGIGVQHPAEVSETSLSKFDAFFSVNVRGTVIFTKVVSRAMKLQTRKTISGRNGTRDNVIVNRASHASERATQTAQMPHQMPPQHEF